MRLKTCSDKCVGAQEELARIDSGFCRQASMIDAWRLYEAVYCACGEMENRIKECQLDLYAECSSAAMIRANQLRLLFASFAYALLCALRRIGLAHIQFAQAICGTIRLKLLKVGTLVRVSVRRSALPCLGLSMAI